MTCIDFGPLAAYSSIFDEHQCRLFFVDLAADDVDARMDITELPIKDDALDCIICYHVLEHVRQDILALRELHRVLRPTGELILQVPLQSGQTSTIDYEEKAFTPKDHVREYGRDILKKIFDEGFEITPRDDREGLTATERRLYGISGAITFICRKT